MRKRRDCWVFVTDALQAKLSAAKGYYADLV